VFVALARDASKLSGHPVLAGWLHRTSRYLAAKVIRSDARRRTREQEAVTMNELLSNDPNTSWENISPSLDEALDELGGSDRDVLLLRYFQNRSASQIAQIFDITEVAAQKRVSRATERLRDLFTKRGISVGVPALVAAVSANAVQAAPASLITTISG